MNRPISGSVIYEGSRPVMVGGEPVVIKGEVCTCDK